MSLPPADLNFPLVLMHHPTKPISNLCFVIKNWGNRTSKAKISINKVSKPASPDFRQGVIIDTDGTYTMIIWIGLLSNSVQNFEITRN